MELTKHYPLSELDIKKAFDGKVKILKYNEIKNYNNVDELLYPYDRVVILWVKHYSNPDYGHWTCLYRSNGGKNVPKGRVYYLDSYGTPIEGVLKKIDKKSKVILDEHEGYLKKMFDKDDIYYNNNQLQERIKTIATCGRHCITRMVFDNLTSKEYADFLRSYGNPDDVVTIATNPLLFS